jgi:hemerythrin
MATQLRWTEDLRVGVEEVDRQHQRLLYLMERLHHAMLEGRGKEVLGHTIDELLEYTVTHFATEERLFRAHHYPAEASHKSEHQYFIDKVTDFKHGFAEDRVMLSLDVMDFLSEWLVDHISETDKAFGPFLNSRGVV